jgi:signal transduction histidine kinase
VVHELSHLARGRHLTLSTPMPGSQLSPPLWVLADSFRMQQVIRNILANAIRFAPEGSTITLDWSIEDKREACITVRDHGPGIPEAELDSIFEAFVQSSRTKSGAGGTGLGLAICRKIVAAHQGAVRAFNHPEGGAVFEVRLPMVSAPGSLPVAPDDGAQS